MGLLRRLRTEDDEMRSLRDLAPGDDQLGFGDLPDEDESILPAAAGDELVAVVLPDVVFEALDLSVLSDGQRERVLRRVLSGITAAA